MPPLIQTLGNFFGQVVLGNELKYWLLTVLILVIGVATKQFVSGQISKIAYRFVQRIKLETPAPDGTYSNHGVLKFYQEMHIPLENLFTWLYIYLAFSFLVWPPSLIAFLSPHINPMNISSFVYKTALIFIIATMCSRFIGYLVDNIKQSQAEIDHPKVSSQALMFMKEAGRIGIYIVAFLVFLGVALGRDVGAIVGGLGIGGLAIAFAAKETLENLIASVIIFVDKPFRVGEFIELDGQKGTVEMVGLRSTRIRTIERTLVAIPNRKIVDGPLNNISSRLHTRVRFLLGLRHGTPVEVIQQMIKVTAIYIEEHQETTDEHYLNITQIQDQGIYVQIVYFINSQDNQVVWQTQQDVNVFILKQIETLGIAFAELVVPPA